MFIFRYDKTFEGLLTAVFDAYSMKKFPDMLLAEEEPPPLFYDEIYTVVTDEERSNRVWNGLQKKLSASGLASLSTCWLSELPGIDMFLFRYMRKAVNAPRSIELNFGDPDVLEISKVWKKVNNERLRVMQFLRFQKAADGPETVVQRDLARASLPARPLCRSKMVALRPQTGIWLLL